MKCKKSFKKLFTILMVYFFSLTLVPFNFLGQSAQAKENNVPTYSNFTHFYLYYAYQYKDKTLLYGDNDLNVKTPKKLMLKDGDKYKTVSDNFVRPYNAFYTDKGITFLSDTDILSYDYESDSLTKVDEESIIKNIVEPALKSAFAKDYKDYTLSDINSNSFVRYIKSNGDIVYTFTLDGKKDDEYSPFTYIVDSKGKIYHSGGLYHYVKILDTVGDKVLIEDFYLGEITYLLSDGNSTKAYSNPIIDMFNRDAISLTKDGNLAYIHQDFENNLSKLTIAKFDDKTKSIVANKTLTLPSVKSSLIRDFNSDLWIHPTDSEPSKTIYKVLDDSISPKYKFTEPIYNIAIYDENNMVAYSYALNEKGSYVTTNCKVEEPSELDLKFKTAHESTVNVKKKANKHGINSSFDAKDGFNTDKLVAAVKDGLQKDIVKARADINALPDEILEFKQTFSSILDNYQHPIYEKIVTVINENTKKESPSQKELNAGRHLIQDIPNENYKCTWSNDLDSLQGVLFTKATALVDKASESKAKVDIDNAKKAIAELEENEFLTKEIKSLISNLKEKLGMN